MSDYFKADPWLKWKLIAIACLFMAGWHIDSRDAEIKPVKQDNPYQMFCLHGGCK